MEVDPAREHVYIPAKRRYKDAVTILDSHKCPLCGKTGHLPQDCYLASGKYIKIDNYQKGETNQPHYIHGESLPFHEKEKVQSKNYVIIL